MRIAHYLKKIRLEDGGVVRAVLDMCMYQARAGHDVTLITCDDHDVPQPWKDRQPGTPRIARIDQPRKLAWLDRRFAQQLRPLIQQIDVLHLHVVWDPSQIPIARVAQELGRPYVQSPHGMLADWSVLQKKLRKDIYYSLFARKLLEGAAFVVTTAQGELDQTQKRHPSTPGVAIPLVFDLAPYRHLEGPEPARQNLKLPSPEVPSLIYLSRLHYKKRPDLLIEAARPLRDRGLAFNVVMAGPSDEGYEAQLRNLACERKVDDITTFLGMVPARYKASLFEACDLFVLPTSMENFGFVYFEALACETPLVTTKGTDTWKELMQSGGGHIVERIDGSIDELVGKIADLLANRDAIKPMGRAGRQWVLENLEPDIIVARYIAMYEEAVRGTRAKRIHAS
jgi:glycosyltransferase involved in cell wall biosynthesis